MRESFACDDADALIARLSKRFAGVLVTISEDGTPVGTHMPILWDADKRLATGHIARANPQWRGSTNRGLIILAGPQAYVSPNWYPSKVEDNRAVPTWNYEAVHLSGRIEWSDDPDRLESIVRDLSTFHESGQDKPWKLEDAPRAYIDAMLRGIIGVTLHADRVDAVRKLSQNQSGADYAGVIDGLEASGDPAAHEVASLMRALPE